MSTKRPPAPKAGLTAKKGVIMAEKCRDLNRQTGCAGGDYDEDFR